MPSASCAHRLERTKDRISVYAFLYFLQMPHVFKIKISLFQIMARTKRQKDSLLQFCYGFNKALGFFDYDRPLA
jgi:hypothetical protein